jgi:hypothetical protein
VSRCGRPDRRSDDDHELKALAVGHAPRTLTNHDDADVLRGRWGRRQPAGAYSPSIEAEKGNVWEHIPPVGSLGDVQICRTHMRTDAAIETSVFLFWVFYIGPFSCAPLLIATLNFCSSSVLPTNHSLHSEMRPHAVSVSVGVPDSTVPPLSSSERVP